MRKTCRGNEKIKKGVGKIGIRRNRKIKRKKSTRIIRVATILSKTKVTYLQHNGDGRAGETKTLCKVKRGCSQTFITMEIYGI